MATLKEIAKLTGVHPSIVSRTINNDPNLKIKPETKVRILKVVEELNYRPNMAARSLKKGETKILGLAIPSFFNPVVSSIIHGAELQAQKEGYNLLVYGAEREQAKVVSSLIDNRIDGLLISNSHFDDSEILELIERDFPIVLVNRRVSGLHNYVTVNDLMGAKKGVQHLIEYGHKQIGHIAGPLFTTTGIERLQGYRSAINEANIEFVSEYVQESDYTIEDGYRAMRKLLSLSNPPTAVFAASITISLGAMKAIREFGLSIPENISLVGYHDVYFADSLNPPLTTVAMPLEEMGSLAIEKLLRILQHNDNGEGIVLQGGTIISRGSVKKI
ncbi:LacI family DNA-binding transcriptional regulator [Bacillus rubiinfantis]|uniref:LacI family DNA-binding transcriptional regulator n=1 Tax=Bacillus rubiinfantis TaxID=1499680 RepID=UPI0005A9EFC3|nr:LacI family DNA-binding transcriptional regulator [Bacillus rubiinfantis]